MKLKIGESGHLLAKMLQRANGIEAVQGALERQMGIHAVQHLDPGVDDVEPLSPIENRHIRRQFTKCFGEARAPLMRNRIDLLWASCLPYSYSASSFVEGGETIQNTAVKTAPSNVGKESLVMNKRRQGWHFHLCWIRRRSRKRHRITGGHIQRQLQRARRVRKSGRRSCARVLPLFSLRPRDPCARSQDATQRLSIRMLLLGSCGSGMASLRCRPATLRVVTGEAPAFVIKLASP